MFDSLQFKALSIMLVISLIGLINNAFCVYIFYIAKNMNAKFLKMLKYFTINSLFVNLFDLILTIIYFIVNDFFYTLIYLNGEKTQQVYPTFEGISYFKLYYIVSYQSVWTIFWFFGASFDIFIVYERIQLYLPKLKF